jgi:hypothetical protein
MADGLTGMSGGLGVGQSTYRRMGKEWHRKKRIGPFEKSFEVGSEF